MAVAKIRVMIRQAADHERQTLALRSKLQPRLPELASKLVLDEESPLDSVMGFIQSYIESVPGSITLVTAVSKQLGFQDYAAPFLQMAEDYLLRPPDALTGAAGLESLLEGAFLAHRLLEEVNDQHIRHLHRPLLPLDMTEANIIVHHLLGEPLAIKLEQLVSLTASRIFHKEYVWEKAREMPGTSSSADLVLSTENLTRAPGSIRLRLGA